MKKERSNLIKYSEKKCDFDIEKLIMITEGTDLEEMVSNVINGNCGSIDIAKLKKVMKNTTENGSQDTLIESLRTLWRKEKNRIAAKKSREKKANLMIELEKKEMHLSSEVENLKRLLIEYENIIETLLRYIKFTVTEDLNYGGENTYNKLVKNKEGWKDKREIYKKLIRCLEFHYHIRNNENYVLPYDTRNYHHHVSNRLIDEILFSLKNRIRYYEIPK